MSPRAFSNSFDFPLTTSQLVTVGRIKLSFVTEQSKVLAAAAYVAFYYKLYTYIYTLYILRTKYTCYSTRLVVTATTSGLQISSFYAIE